MRLRRLPPPWPARLKRAGGCAVVLVAGGFLPLALWLDAMQAERRRPR